MIKHDEDLMSTWSQKELETTEDYVKIVMRLRVITEYVDPNFENVYPEDITRYLEEVAFEAQFGQSYYLVITGDKLAGYHVEVQENQ